MSQILVIDDEPAICWGLQQALADLGHHVTMAGTAAQGIQAAERGDYQLVILDVRLPGEDGLSALPRIRDVVGEAVPFVVMTAFGDLETAVRAVRGRAFDYVTKPFDLDQMLAVVRRGLERINPAQTTPASGQSSATERTGCLLGQSAAMQRVFKDIALVAPTTAPVLITGESGVGKEEVALAIHRFSPRHEQPFVPIFLGALSPGLVESELFGHTRGAFTGATTSKSGLLALADEGTAFLDEIGDVPLPLQIKLLRAIERKEITPVGEATASAVNFRVLAATHRSLPDMVARGEFREDLLYRIGVYQIVVPPLRERRDDIPLLARHFLREITQKLGQSAEFSDAALEELTRRRWRGNVRELRNSVERAAIVSRGETIQPCHLAPEEWLIPKSQSTDTVTRLTTEVRHWAEETLESQSEIPAAAGDLYDRFLQVVEPPLLQATLARTQQQRGLAAQLLGIHRSTLRQKLSRMGQDDE